MVLVVNVVNVTTDELPRHGSQLPTYQNSTIPHVTKFEEISSGKISSGKILINFFR